MIKFFKTKKKQYFILYLLQYIHTISFYLLIPRNIYIEDYKLITRNFNLFYNIFSDIFIVIPIVLGLLIVYIRLILINLDKWYRPKIRKSKTPYGYINLATMITMYSSRNGTFAFIDNPNTYKNINILNLSIISLIFLIFLINNYRYNFNN